MLILIVFLALPVALDIPDVCWISPDYRIVEEWTLDPFEYVSTERRPLGCINESNDESGYTWNITLLEEECLYRFEDSRLIEQIDIDISIHEHVTVVFSPSGNYLLLFDQRDNNCLRVDLKTMQCETVVLFNNSTPQSPNVMITDSGSIAVAFTSSEGERSIRIFNHELVLVLEETGYRFFNEQTTHDGNGTRFFCTKMNQLLAFDDEGTRLWNTELDLAGDLFDFVWGFTTCYNGSLVAVQRTGLIQLFDGSTGVTVFSEEYDFSVANPLFNRSGSFLALEFQGVYTEGSCTSGISLYNLNSLQTGVPEAIFTSNTIEASTRFIPLAVSDIGWVLARLKYIGSIDAYHLILLDSSGNPLWISSAFSSKTRRFTPSCGGVAGMSDSGESIWHFDGELIHLYSFQDVR
jgi:hypothetical protein